MTTQETAHAIALIVGLPMLAVMILERSQRSLEFGKKRRKTSRTHGPRERYKIARPTSARTTTNNNRKDSK